MLAGLRKLFGRKRREDEHVEVRNLSSDYIEGDLDQETEDRINAHLEWCPPCRTFIETLRATVKLLGLSKRQQAPTSFRERLLERLRREASH